MNEMDLQASRSRATNKSNEEYKVICKSNMFLFGHKHEKSMFNG